MIRIRTDKALGSVRGQEIAKFCILLEEEL